MFKLNQPIVKNKVLTWSRDLTIVVRYRFANTRHIHFCQGFEHRVCHALFSRLLVYFII